jgi:polyisoprenyl-phosphate glycosyltransferase
MIMKRVAVIIPLYNEEGNIRKLVESVSAVFAGLPYDYEFIFTDDGSKDASLDVVKGLAAENHRVNYISFSRNFGKDFALKAGLDLCTSDIAITMDADLQHPPELIPPMLKRWEEGYHVVYAYREERNQNTTRAHQVNSYLFYKMMNNLSELDLEQGISDYRLLDRKVIEVVQRFHENEIFLRGLIKWLGFSQIGIGYTPFKRNSGKTSYSKKRLIRLALQGITSFSTRPLYIAAYLGFFFSLASVLYIPYVIYSYYFGHAISGWASVIVTIAFFGGLQLTILGIIGIYLGKLFMQAKDRPLYIVKETNLHGK